MNNQKSEAINFLQRKTFTRTGFYKVDLPHSISKQVVNSYHLKVSTEEVVSFIVDWQLSGHKKVNMD